MKFIKNTKTVHQIIFPIFFEKLYTSKIIYQNKSIKFHARTYSNESASFIIFTNSCEFNQYALKLEAHLSK